MLTTQPIEEPEDSKHFQQVLEMFDAERMLMFSSDYPHWDGDTPGFRHASFAAGAARRGDVRQCAGGVQD